MLEGSVFLYENVAYKLENSEISKLDFCFTEENVLDICGYSGLQKIDSIIPIEVYSTWSDVWVPFWFVRENVSQKGVLIPVLQADANVAIFSANLQDFSWQKINVNSFVYCESYLLELKQKDNQDFYFVKHLMSVSKNNLLS